MVCSRNERSKHINCLLFFDIGGEKERTLLNNSSCLVFFLSDKSNHCRVTLNFKAKVRYEQGRCVDITF